MMEIIKTFIIGIFVGIANVIPGVSGGTLVVVFNIYDKFVNAITLNIKKLIQNWKFVIPMILGMASGILIFSKAITFLYENYPIYTNFFFMGLIIGSIPLLFKFATDQSKKKFSTGTFVSVIICIIVGIAVILTFNKLQGMFIKTEVKDLILPDLTFGLFLKLFAGGILGAVAMIIPGISGSLIMLILGIYTIIISAIPALLAKATFVKACILLIPNGLGIIFGLLAGAKLISILIEKVPNHTYAVILGLIIGSAFVIFPGVSGQAPLNIIIDLVCVVLGFCLAYFSTKLTENKDNKESV